MAVPLRGAAAGPRPRHQPASGGTTAKLSGEPLGWWCDMHGLSSDRRFPHEVRLLAASPPHEHVRGSSSLDDTLERVNIDCGVNRVVDRTDDQSYISQELAGLDGRGIGDVDDIFVADLEF